MVTMTPRVAQLLEEHHRLLEEHRYRKQRSDWYRRAADDMQQQIIEEFRLDQQHRAHRNTTSRKLLRNPVQLEQLGYIRCSDDPRWRDLVEGQQFNERLSNQAAHAAHTVQLELMLAERMGHVLTG